MYNSYYDPYAQPYCRAPVQQCKCSMQDRRDTAYAQKPTHTEKCDCKRRETQEAENNQALAMAYVPFQVMEEVYDCHKAFEAGTLFPELNKPFKGCCRYE